MKTKEIPYAELTLSRDAVAWRPSCTRNSSYNYLEKKESDDFGFLFDVCDDGACARLRDARLAQGRSLEAFARELGVARNEALAWETNARCPAYWLRKASELLQVDYEWLATGVGVRERREHKDAPSEEERRALCELLRKLVAILES